MLSFEVKPHGRLTIMHLDGDIDLDGAMKLKEKIQETRKSGACILVLNMQGVNKVTSSVLQHLVSPIRALTLVNGVVALCNMSNAVHKFIQTSMIFNIVTVYSTEEDAIAELADNSEKEK